MNKLFVPATLIMDRLRYSTKFSVIFAVILIPLIVLSSMLISEISSEIAFLEHEHQGVVYLKAVRQPIEHMQQHRA